MATKKTNTAAPQGGDQQATRARGKTNTGKENKPEATPRAQSSRSKPSPTTVTFQVTVPESTARLRRQVYISGTFNAINNKMIDWDQQGQKMKKVDNTHYTLTMKIPEGTRIEYKYILGDWDHVERDGHCHDTHNRHVTIHGGDTQTIEDVVHNWRNGTGCAE